MAEQPGRVRLVLDDSFSRDMATFMQAVDDATRRWTLSDATWEPHDWSDWS